MITPKFSITQNDEFVLVTIKVPHIRVSSAELVTEDNTFSFYCKPYLLKLTFPHKFKEEDEECKATYDPFCDNGTLTAHLPKLEHGQYFPDLDLTSKLLLVNRHSNKDIPEIPRIEVLKSECIEESNDMTLLEDMDTSTELPDILRAVKQVSYGFNNQYSNVFTHLREELMDMTEIKHPDSILPEFRAVLRVAAENQQFDPERYLGDNLSGESDPIYQEAMIFKTFYTMQWTAWKANKSKNRPSDVHAHTLTPTPASMPKTVAKTSSAAGVEKAGAEGGAALAEDARDTAFESIGGFSEIEKNILTSKLGNREYLIRTGSDEEFALLLGLADILFAYSYDHRLTLGEGTVESAHTISRLSCTFSWLEDYSYHVKHAGIVLPDAGAAREEAVRRTILHCLRRCVIHPYLRVWKLARKVLADVAKILFLGKRAILKCLLQVYATFEHTDTHYLLNKIFVSDYCIWLQTGSLSSESLQNFAKSYNSSKGNIEQLPCEGKELMGFFLPEIEEWAVEVEQDDTSSSGSSSSSSDSASDCDDESTSSGSQSGSYRDSDKDNTCPGEGDVSQSSGKVNVSNNTVEHPSTAPTATPTLQKNEGKDGSGDEEMDVELRVPDKYMDYPSLQKNHSQLEYLAVWGLSPELSASLLGTIPAEMSIAQLPAPPSSSSITASASSSSNNNRTCTSSGEVANSTGVNQMLLLPKRKVDFQGEDASSGGSPAAGPPKRVLIEDITPPPPPGTPANLSPLEATSSCSLRTVSSEASSKVSNEGPDGVLHELSNLSISQNK